jgi:hypothetical protein
MKKLLTLCVLLLTLGVAQAQKVYFIYIQSDGNIPFFVRLGDQVTSSNPAGYLILPKLVDSVYQFTIGKNGQAASESRFSVTINKQDHGYLLREADGKFNLFDLQAMTSIQPIASATSSNESLAKRTDAFSVLLAQAANDPTLLDVRTATAAVQTATGKQPEPTQAVAITTKEPEKPTSTPPQETADTTTTTTNDIAATTEKKETPAETKKEDKKKQDEVKNVDTAQQTTAVVTEPQGTAPEEATPYKRSVVTRKSESSTSEGFGLVFLDKTDEAVDTIRILIPNPSLSFTKEENHDGDLKKFLNITNVDSTKTVATAHDKDLNAAPEKTSDSTKVDSAKETSAVDAANEKLRAAEVNKRKTCAAEASEKDFFKLRKNMAAKESEEAMLDEAKKAFKKSCFSTAQIKNLSSLFLTASGKYHFFDAAYGHVSNQEQYGTLQSELDDAYYANRFKALIANQ